MVELDEIDRRVVACLAQDSRNSMAEIGTALGLSQAAVEARIARLKDSGVIRRFTVETDQAALGLPVLAFVKVALREGASDAQFWKYVHALRHVQECHQVTGPFPYLIKLRLPDLAALGAVLSGLRGSGFHGQSEVLLALCSPVDSSFATAAR